jgi:hypothetical protein
MVRFDRGWSCPACGSAIIETPEQRPGRRDEPPATSAPARQWVVLSA